jgi:hypothetical protein
VIISELVEGGATIDFDVEDLRLLREVFYSGYTGLPQIAGPDPMKFAALQAMGTAFHAAAVACEALPEPHRLEIMKSSEAARVRCKCGKGWTLLQIPGASKANETSFFRWYDAESGREVYRCSSCGQPISTGSTSPS